MGEEGASADRVPFSNWVSLSTTFAEGGVILFASLAGLEPSGIPTAVDSVYCVVTGGMGVGGMAAWWW